MKKHLLLILLLFSSGLSAQDMSVDDILKNSFENLGGLDNIKALKSIKIKGTMAMGEMEFPGTVIQAPDNKQHVEVDIQGKKFVQAYDGEMGWQINPFEGGSNAQKMSPEEAEELSDEPFESSFIDYEKKGHKVTYEGREDVEGTETYVLKLEKANGNVEFHYYDPEYFVPIMTKSSIKSGPMKGQSTETFLSDYQEVEGLMFPFFMDTKMNGESMQKLSIENIELNVDVPDEMFAMPESAASDTPAAAPAEAPVAAPAPSEIPEAAEDMSDKAKKKKKKKRGKK